MAFNLVFPCEVDISNNTSITRILPEYITTTRISTTNISDVSGNTGAVNSLLTSTPSGIKWNTVIAPVNISDTTNSIGSNGNVLLKDTAGIVWRPNLPSLLITQTPFNVPAVVSWGASNNMAFTSSAVAVGTTTATYQICYTVNNSSAGNHTAFTTVARSTVTPATSAAINLAKTSVNLTASINAFGNFITVAGGGTAISTSTATIVDMPGSIGTFYYSVWVWSAQNTTTSSYGNISVVLIKP
jgi:hypothetical protein